MNARFATRVLGSVIALGLTLPIDASVADTVGPAPIPRFEPVDNHCRRGADRTGAMVAFYRIHHHGWTAARAYAEARDLGMRWWHKGLKRQIELFAGTNANPI